MNGYLTNDNYKQSDIKLVQQTIRALINADGKTFVILSNPKDTSCNCIINCNVEIDPETYTRKWFIGELDKLNISLDLINKIIKTYEELLQKREKAELRKHIISTLTTREVDALGLSLSLDEQRIIHDNNNNIMSGQAVFDGAYDMMRKHNDWLHRFGGSIASVPGFLAKEANLPSKDKEFCDKLQFNLSRTYKFCIYPLTDLFLNE